MVRLQKEKRLSVQAMMRRAIFSLKRLHTRKPELIITR